MSDELDVCSVCEGVVDDNDSYIVIGRSGEEPQRVHEVCMATIRSAV